MNAITLITRDHRAIEEAYEDYQNAADEDEKAACASRIFSMLDAHAKMEETYFYPELKKEGKKEEGLIHEAADDHADIKHLVAVAKTVEGEEGLDTALGNLMDAVSEHVEEEESDILPQAEKDMSERELESLGRKMEPHSASVETIERDPAK